MTDTRTKKAAGLAALRSIKVLQNKGWCRHTFKDSKGRRCMLGALEVATKSFAVRDLVKSSLRDDLNKKGPNMSIICFNDDYAEDRREVISIFRRAAKRLLGAKEYAKANAEIDR